MMFQILAALNSFCFIIAAILTFSLSIYLLHPAPAHWKHALRNIAGLLGTVGFIRIAFTAGWLSVTEVTQYTGIGVLAFTLLLAENVVMCRIEHAYHKKRGA